VASHRGSPRAEAIRRVRGELSQQQFADYLGVTVTTISRYERGATPEINVLRKVYERAVSLHLWEEVRTLAEEIFVRTGLDAATRLMMLVPTETNKDSSETNIKSEITSEAFERFMQEYHHAMGRATYRLYATDNEERQVIAAVVKFLRDENTSEVERKTLYALLSKHMHAKETSTKKKVK